MICISRRSDIGDKSLICAPGRLVKIWATQVTDIQSLPAAPAPTTR
jgi:hypothetical protein